MDEAERLLPILVEAGYAEAWEVTWNFTPRGVARSLASINALHGGTASGKFCIPPNAPGQALVAPRRRSRKSCSEPAGATSSLV